MIEKLEAADISVEDVPGGILVLALAEGPALFGLVCVFLAWNMGQLEASPAVWANTASTLGLLAAAVAVFPTEFRLRALVERYVQRVDVSSVSVQKQQSSKAVIQQ